MSMTSCSHVSEFLRMVPLHLEIMKTFPAPNALIILASDRIAYGTSEPRCSCHCDERDMSFKCLFRTPPKSVPKREPTGKHSSARFLLTLSWGSFGIAFGGAARCGGIDFCKAGASNSLPPPRGGGIAFGDKTALSVTIPSAFASILCEGLAFFFGAVSSRAGSAAPPSTVSFGGTRRKFLATPNLMRFGIALGRVFAGLAFAGGGLAARKDLLFEGLAFAGGGIGRAFAMSGDCFTLESAAPLGGGDPQELAELAGL
jgi:hypothetical protein